MKQILAGVTGVSISALTPLTVVAQTYGFNDHPHGWDGGWGYMLFGPLMMIVAVALVVVLAVLAVRWLGGPGTSQGAAPTASPPSRSPLDILKERFARGEIDKAEFEERQRVLES